MVRTKYKYQPIIASTPWNSYLMGQSLSNILARSVAMSAITRIIARSTVLVDVAQDTAWSFSL